MRYACIYLLYRCICCCLHRLSTARRRYWLGAFSLLASTYRQHRIVLHFLQHLGDGMYMIAEALKSSFVYKTPDGVGCNFKHRTDSSPLTLLKCCTSAILRCFAQRRKFSMHIEDLLRNIEWLIARRWVHVYKKPGEMYSDVLHTNSTGSTPLFSE